MADPLAGLIDSFTSRAVDSASAAAAAQADARWQEVKPQVLAAAALVSFLAVTTWLFYFLPRFVAPWKRAA